MINGTAESNSAMKYNSLFYATSLALLLLNWGPAFPSGTTHSSRITIVDDGARNASFSSFRSRLLQAIKQRDRNFVEQIVSAHIQTGLGAATGKQAFNEQWDNLSNSSTFWPRFARALNHGAKYERETGEYEAPAIDFEDNGGEQIQGVVWNKRSILHEAPSSSSCIVRVLDCESVDILKPADPAPIKEEWVKVKTKSGELGFLKSEDIFSAYDEYASFKKLGEKWQLTWFGVAGL
jgi:hypothetical protein